jgi:hypothetical protein
VSVGALFLFLFSLNGLSLFWGFDNTDEQWVTLD